MQLKLMMIAFFEPTNITELTEEEIRKSRLDAFTSAVGNPYIAKQFALKYYLKLTEEEYNENQRLLIIENQEKFKSKDVPLPTEDKNQAPGLRSVGVEDIPMEYLNDISNDMGATPMGGDMGGFGAPMGGDMGGDMGGAPMGGDMGGAPMGGDMGGAGMTGGM